jgi:hypothetical protein
MSEELLPFQESLESLSPKILWIQKHNLIVEATNAKGESPESGEDIPAWVCRIDKGPGETYLTKEIGGGETPEEAMLDFCQNSGIMHYTLENP